MAVGRPIPHTAHLRDCSTRSIGYSYEVRPTFRLLPWAISPTHCTTRSQLTIIDTIGQRRLRQYMPHCIRPRLRYYKRSYSFNPQSRFPDHSAESTGGLHRPNGILSRTSKTLTPWLQHRDRESNPGPTNGERRSQDCAIEPLGHDATVRRTRRVDSSKTYARCELCFLYCDRLRSTLSAFHDRANNLIIYSLHSISLCSK